MKKYPNLSLGLALLVLLTLGAIQNVRVDHVRDSARFYGWILTAATQVRLTGHAAGWDPKRSEEEADVLRDVELFERLVEQSEEYLPDVPATESDYDAEGKLLPKIVRYTAFMEVDEAEGLAEDEVSSVLDTPEQRARDQEIWRLAKGPQLADLRVEFLTCMREGTLSGLGTQIGVSDLYNPEGGSPSLSNVFFGFRKMAANLLWLKVDTMWHRGEMFRMLPSMTACVKLDPTFVDAYLVGAWQLAYNASVKRDPTPWEYRRYNARHKAWVGPKEQLYYDGVGFLLDGVTKNRRNYKLHFDLGYAIYEEKLEDHPHAVVHLSEAVRLWHDIWVPRVLYRCMMYNEQYEEAKAGWERYIDRYPDSKSSVDVAPRFIKINQARIYERESEYASTKADCARELAARATARGESQKAEDYAAQAEAAAQEAERQNNLALETWQDLLDQSGEEVIALARKARLEALALAAEDRPYEAILLLEKARFDSNQFFWEGLDLMIEMKNEFDIPLSKSESMYVARNELAREYTALLPKSIAAKNFDFVEDCWRQDGFNPETAAPTAVAPDSDELLALTLENPVVARFVDELDGPVIFKAGEQWYRCEKELPSHLIRPGGPQPVRGG